MRAQRLVGLHVLMLTAALSWVACSQKSELASDVLTAADESAMRAPAAEAGGGQKDSSSRSNSERGAMANAAMYNAPAGKGEAAAPMDGFAAAPASAPAPEPYVHEEKPAGYKDSAPGAPAGGLALNAKDLDGAALLAVPASEAPQASEAKTRRSANPRADALADRPGLAGAGLLGSGLVDSNGPGGLGARGLGFSGGSQGGGLGASGASVSSSRARMITPEPPPIADKNGWFQNTYQAGVGSRESLEKAVSEGVLVDGKRIKLASFTRSFKQDFPFPTKGALGMDVRTERAKIDPAGGSVFLQVGVQAAPREFGARPPLNVALVIDRSGSMVVEGKIEAVRAAAREIVDRLGPNDKLALITYSTQASLDFPMAPVKNKAALKAIIDRIRADGGTNIYGGMSAGYEQLRKFSRPHEANLELVLTDGQVSAGERDPQKFEALAREAADHDITTTAMGMGVTYNEDLLMTVSRSGGGSYHFIKGSSDVSAVVNAELNDLSTAIARGVRMRVVLPDDVELVRVLGSDQLSAAQAHAVKKEERKIDQKVYEELGIRKDRADQDEPGVKMLIPSFGANDSHVVLMELRVPPGRGTRDLATVYLKYKDMLQKSNAELQSAARMTYAPDRSAAVSSTVPSVKKNILGFQTGEVLMGASKHVANGNVAEAVRRIDDQMVLVGVAAREWKDPDLKRDAELLGQYKDLLVAYGRKGVSTELAAYLGKSFSYSAYQRLQ